MALIYRLQPFLAASPYWGQQRAGLTAVISARVTKKKKLCFLFFYKKKSSVLFFLNRKTEKKERFFLKSINFLYPAIKKVMILFFL